MRQPARSRTVRRAAAPVLVLSLISGCATNPATGKRQLMIVSEAQEVEMGRGADKEVEASFGLYPDEKVQAYVARLGASLASGSERPSLPWTFRVVDDPTVNAFALPGGFIYVTRGLMTHLNSEAELASVLGHEIGHVTARHTASMISKQQFAMLGLGIGMVVRPELQQFGDLAQTGMGLMFLKFGRDAERQADDLGLRYLGRQGYDPQQAVEVFSVLERASAKTGEGRLPSWLSTHPAPEDRAQRLRAAITAGSMTGSKVERRAYLDQIDGMVFGENPREGFFVQNTFYHPELKFSFAYPRGWKAENQRQAVGAVSPNQDAIVVLSMGRGTSADQAAQEFFRQQGLRAANTPQRATINGLRAVTGVFEAVSGQTLLAGRVAFIEHGGKVYRVLGYTPQARWSSYDRIFEEVIRSFDNVTERRYLDVQPRRLEIVPLREAMSVAAFASRHPTPVSADVLALINGVPAGGTLPAGEPVKTVVGGRLPGETN